MAAGSVIRNHAVPLPRSQADEKFGFSIAADTQQASYAPASSVPTSYGPPPGNSYGVPAPAPGGSYGVPGPAPGPAPGGYGAPPAPGGYGAPPVSGGYGAPPAGGGYGVSTPSTYGGTGTDLSVINSDSLPFFAGAAITAALGKIQQSSTVITNILTTFIIVTIVS